MKYFARCLAADIVVFLSLLTFGLTSCGNSKVGYTSYNLIDTVYVDENSPYYLTIKIDWQYPDRLSDKDALTALQYSVLSDVFGEKFAEYAPMEAMNAYVLALATDFRDTYSAYTSDFTAMKQCSFDMTAEITCENTGFVTYKSVTYSYMGGAHGIVNTLFRNYSMATGKAILEEDLFVSGYEDALIAMMQENLAASDENVNSVEDLKTYYFVEGIKPNGNFYITDSGITYVFNPYEAAAYARGTVEIYVSKENLQPLLKSDIPIW